MDSSSTKLATPLSDPDVAAADLAPPPAGPASPTPSVAEGGTAVIGSALSAETLE
jgi:hypothetical protein